MSCPQTHNCLLTGYGAPRAPITSRDPITGLLRDWVQIFKTPTLAGYCKQGVNGKDVLDGELVGQGWDGLLAGAGTGEPLRAP